MKNKLDLIYEGKAKKIFSHEDSDKVIIEFKDDATAFNALKKAQFKGKGELNCLITSKIFKFLVKKASQLTLSVYRIKIQLLPRK